jgi:hypothetical protein
VRVEPIAWQSKYGRTVGWSFAVGTGLSSERALFAVTALDASPADLGMRTELVPASFDVMDQVAS